MLSPSAKEELLQKIESSLTSIRPYLEKDGGNVRVVGITDDMTVEVELLGACASCDISTMTMRAGIEESIRRAVPGIKEVKAVNQDGKG